MFRFSPPTPTTSNFERPQPRDNDEVPISARVTVQVPAFVPDRDRERTVPARKIARDTQHPRREESTPAMASSVVAPRQARARHQRLALARGLFTGFAAMLVSGSVTFCLYAAARPDDGRWERLWQYAYELEAAMPTFSHALASLRDDGHGTSLDVGSAASAAPLASPPPRNAATPQDATPTDESALAPVTVESLPTASAELETYVVNAGASSRSQVARAAHERQAQAEREVLKLSEALQRCDAEDQLCIEDHLDALSRLATRGLAITASVEALSKLGGEHGADALFRLVESLPTGDFAGDMALQLLETHELRNHTSPALDVALRLHDAQTCEQHLPLLRLAARVGDERSLRKLMTLTDKVGCGERGGDDCYPCLRPGRVLLQSIAALRQRLD